MKKLTEQQMRLRDNKLRKLYDTGRFSMRKLAKKINLSKSRVQEIIAEYSI